MSDSALSEVQARFLAEAGAALASSLDYEQILGRLAELAVPALADWCTIILRDSDGGPRRVAVVAADPADAALAELIRRLPVPDDPQVVLVRAMVTGELALLDPVPPGYIDRLPDPQFRERMREVAPGAILGLPLIVRGITHGAFTLVMSRSGRHFEPDTVALAQELARRAAVAVDNAILYREARRHVAELATVQRVARAITSAVRLDEICRTVVHHVSEAFGYRRISVYLRDGDALLLQAVTGYGTVLRRIALDAGVIGRVARTGEPAFVRDAAADPEFIAVEPGICQGIFVPLRYEGDPVLGVLSVESDGCRRLSEHDLALLSLLADQISVAVVNARLFARVEDAANRFQSLVETAGSVIFCADPELRVTEFNRQAELVFGRRRAEVIGVSFLDSFVGAQDRDPLRAVAARALACDSLRPFEWSIFDVHGQERFYVWSVTCRRDPEGAPAELFVVGHDLTEQREAEQARLAVERKMLDAQRLESLGLLAGGIAHDFNNLLAAILGNASLLLLDLPPGTEAHHSARQIELVTQRASDLVGQMLAYAGRGRFVLQRLSLNELVAEMIVLLRVSVSKGAALIQHLAPGLPPVEVDAAQIRQVVMNLIVNASEALTDQGGTITLATGRTAVATGDPRLTPDLAPGEYVTLTVTDDGVGMDEATLSRIFDPFFSTKFAGRGLGLAAVLGIVRAHRGGLLASSRPGAGSSFSVLLPVSDEDAAAGADLTPAAGAIAGASGGPLVLVIDDEDGVRRTTARILERGGYTVVSAADGEGGVALAANLRQPLAAVLLDLTLPRSSGEAIFRQLRRVRPATPVVVMSGYSADEMSSRFIPDAPAAFLQKPFGAGDLLGLLRHVIAPGT
jgi:PAS domain S-box-containing protein